MAGYRPYSYQYETSPRKLQPDYEVRGNNTVKKKKSTFAKILEQFKDFSIIILIVVFIMNLLVKLISYKINKKRGV